MLKPEPFSKLLIYLDKGQMGNWQRRNHKSDTREEKDWK